MPYQESIIIQRPVDEVFAYMDDIEREPEWQPNLREVAQTPEGQPAVGTEKRYVSDFMGRRFENTYVNTVYEPNRRVAYIIKPGSDLKGEGEITWEAVDGGTKVTMEVAPKVSGFLKFMPKGVLEALYSKELQATLVRLKKHLESSGG